MQTQYLRNVMVLTQSLKMRVKLINTVFMGLIGKLCYALRELQRINVNI